jgi:hypothetical protein
MVCSFLSVPFPCSMAPIDLNMPPDLEVYEAVDWSSIGDWDGAAYELDYDLVWDGGHEGAIHLFH